MPHIVLLPGDGIGPEVTAEAAKCLELLSDACDLDLDFETLAIGGGAIDAGGDPLPAETLAACERADAILLGAVGGPRWDGAARRPEAGLLELRSRLGLYANLRPARVIAGMERFSPLKADLAAGADVLVVRELTGGLYFGDKSHEEDQASDLCTYSRAEVERIAHVAFQAARRRHRRVTSVDKANVLATSRLWRRIVDEVAQDYPDVALDHLYVDAAAMALATRPARFDVILTENMFGDILSDQLSAIGGSIGLLASASAGDQGALLFEPIHGSAPDLAGRDVANPAGAIASAAMLLDLALHLPDEARILNRALESALVEGCRTADLDGDHGCAAFGARVREILEALLLRRSAIVELVTMNRGCCA
ncbi:MAG TPA: 3-isopropylmalate dehydrogenase [Allosphingosinicella sp.]|nr:3-isopropylmalate dehydrogenase [Allosphingosinicella sp.]